MHVTKYETGPLSVNVGHLSNETDLGQFYCGSFSAKTGNLWVNQVTLDQFDVFNFEK